MYLRSAFWSFYSLILLSFVSFATIVTFRMGGDFVGLDNHIDTQMELYLDSIERINILCVKRFGVSKCKNLSFDFDGGYLSSSTLTPYEGNIHILDIFVEYKHPLSSNIFRNSKRVFFGAP